MAQRGRKSAAALQVIDTQGAEIVPIPRPPSTLTASEAEEWRAIVNEMPADWFGRETQSMLEALCRHIVSSRKVAQLKSAAEEAESVDLAEYDRILKMQERESRCIATLATKMRLSQQTAYHREKRRGPSAKRPWNIEG